MVDQSAVDPRVLGQKRQAQNAAGQNGAGQNGAGQKGVDPIAAARIAVDDLGEAQRAEKR